MLKKNLYLITLLSLVLLISACSKEQGGSSTETNKDGNNDNSSDEVITLKVADFFPTTHYLSKEGSVFFINKAEELTNGRVKFEYFPTEQLAASKDLLDATKSNITDIGQIQVGYVADKIPLSGVAEIPGSFDNTIDGSKAYWELLDKVLYEQEFKKNNIKPLFDIVLPPYQLFTVKEPIETVDDIKGLKVRAGGGAQSLLADELGGVPVSMTGHEVYSSLERGVINSVLFPITSIQSYSLQEIAKYSTIGLNFGSTAHVWGINEKVWSTLPSDIQDALLEAGQATMTNLAEYQENAISTAIKELEEQGVTFAELDSQEVEKIQTSVDAVWEDWVSKLEERGLPAQKVKDEFLKLLNK
jgi:TRAP-type C4-dicarboxylate transport system substrate-binding protein